MELQGQLRRADAGYAMAALLVAMGVMSILATAAMPAWKQMAQREKEAELVFRGEQYARAIGLFQRRAGPGVNPPNLDVLVQQKFLRKKYKDPITGGDFDLISPTTAMSVPTAPTPGAPTVPGGRAVGPTGRGTQNQPGTAPGSIGAAQERLSAAARGMQPQPIGGAPVGFGGTVAGGIVGVQSKSKEKSIRIYNGRTHYNEWQFVYVPQTPQPGGPGQRGGPQRGEPQRGGPLRGDPQRRGGPGVNNPPTAPPPSRFGRPGGPF
jgi:type II secretory pathway pseudopilin PulG